MTHSPAEVELSPEAAGRLEDYLRQVRAALAGTEDVSADEIEADIREHVENELRAAPRPVPLSALEAVLARLDPPSQWGTTGDPTLLRRAGHLLRERLRGARAGVAGRWREARDFLWRGPEDWRLPYLSFGVFSLGILSFFTLFPVTLPVSYFLSRAGIAYARERGIELGSARKWLLYPPVVVVSLTLLVGLMAWPAVAAPVAFEEVHHAAQRVQSYDRRDPKPSARAWGGEPSMREERELLAWRERQANRERMALRVEEDRNLLNAIPVPQEWAATASGWFAGAGSLALWWLVLGVAAATYPGAARAVFFPLLDRFERRHGLLLAVVCLVALVPWSLTAYEVAAGLM